MIDAFDIFSGDHGGHASVSRSTTSARSKDSASDHSMRLLEERIEKLTLVNMAMWSLLQDKIGLTEKDLLDRVKIIDLMDGVADGKATRTVAKCPECSRTMSPRHQRCLYCGHEKLVQSAFDAI